VGLFSFLKGKEEKSAFAAEEPAASARPPASAGPAVVESPPPAGETSEKDSTFTPPPAWNLDALLAPPPESATETPQIGPLDRAITAELQPSIVEAIKTVFDPEIPVDIYELGLIYEIIADADRRVLIRMTLTSPACPSAQQIPSEVRYKIKALPGVSDAFVEIVWEPPWDKERMSEAAKLSLGFL